VTRRNIRNVGILIFDGVDLLDFAGPFEVFHQTRLAPGVQPRRSRETAPFEVFTVAPTSAPVRANGGVLITPHHSFADTPRIDLLVVPGGLGTRRLIHDRELIDWLRDRAATAERVASVCTGALLLAQAGLLQDRRATTHWAAADLLESLGSGAIVVRDQRVVEDGIVTSAGVSSGIDMAFHVVEALFGRGVAEDTARYIEYQLQKS